MVHYLATQIPGMVIGFVVGAFMPGVGRMIKSWFSKEASSVKSKL